MVQLCTEGHSIFYFTFFFEKKIHVYFGDLLLSVPIVYLISSTQCYEPTEWVGRSGKQIIF